jgi:hypothetical protein
VKRISHIAGHAACFIALFAMLGGHWFVLQSVAWTRMLADFSQQDSLLVAISKTFDGEHPCPMCRKIQAGRQQEEQQEKNKPLLKIEKMPDLILDKRQSLLTFVPAEADDAVPTVPRLRADFIEFPPVPPPAVVQLRLCGRPFGATKNHHHL